MKKYKENIISVILAIILVIFIWHNFLVSANNVIFIFIFAACYLVLKNILTKNINKREIIVSSIIAAVFSIMEVICKSINVDYTLNHIIDKWLIINLAGYFISAYVVILWIYDIFENNRLQTFENKLKENKFFKHDILLVIICIVLIFLAWLPYFLRYYPGIVTSDSYSQIEQTIGIIPLEDHHPITHTAIIGIFINIGINLFNNINTGIALYSIASMLLMAIFYSLILQYLRKKNVPILVQIIALLYYMFYPVNAMYSITMWKDILFSGIMPVFIILCMELIFSTEKFFTKKSNVVIFIIVTIFTILLRHNGLYVVILTLPFIFVALRKYWKKLLVMFGSTLIIYCVLNILIFNVLKVTKGSVGEMLSVPIQQIARTAKYHEEELDEEIVETINKFFKDERIWAQYNPVLSDPVKFKFNANYFSSNKSEFISLWLKLLVKYPKDYIEAFISNSYGYYYPEAQNSIVSRATMDHNMGIEQTPKIEGKIVEKLDSLTDTRKIPVFSMVFSIGIGFWITVICLGYKIYKKEYKYILVYLPIFVLWLTLIASPAFCEYRYAYPIFTTLPLYIAINFIKRKEPENGENSSINTML